MGPSSTFAGGVGTPAARPSGVMEQQEEVRKSIRESQARLTVLAEELARRTAPGYVGRGARREVARRAKALGRVIVPWALALAGIGVGLGLLSRARRRGRARRVRPSTHLVGTDVDARALGSGLAVEVDRRGHARRGDPGRITGVAAR